MLLFDIVHQNGDAKHATDREKSNVALANVEKCFIADKNARNGIGSWCIVIIVQQLFNSILFLDITQKLIDCENLHNTADFG